MTSSSSPSFEQLQKLRKPLRNVNLEHRENFSVLERLAVWITEQVGSMGFFLAIFFWTMIWLAWNTLAPKSIRFDPFPAFVLWLFLSNMIQIFLMPLIMIGQNLQARHAEARAEADFEVNVLAEKEIELIFHHLEKQGKLLAELIDRLDHTHKEKS